MSSGKPKGKRRGRPPKVVKDPASEFPGMFVLPPNILEKLGINFNMGNGQHSQTSSALPVYQPQESSSGTQVDSNNFAKSVQCNEAVVVNNKLEDSSILETANLMKSSVFLSPTFIHPVTNTNIENAEIEFLSPNQETTATVAVEKQVSEEPLTFPTAEKSHRNHATKDTPDTIKTKKPWKLKRGKVIAVDPEFNEASLSIHAKMLENLRKKIQSTIDNVLTISEEVQGDLVSPEIVASTATKASKPPGTDYVLPESTVSDLNDDLGTMHADLTSQKSVASTDTVEPKRANDHVIPETTEKDLNDNSKIVDAPEMNETNAFKAKLDTSSETHFDYIDNATYVKESFPSFLDSKTTNKSSDMIETLIELSKAEELVAEEMKLENFETSKHLTNIQQNLKTKIPIDSSEYDVQDMPSNENIGTEIIENLRKAITNDIIVLANENKDYSVAEIPDVNIPQRNSSFDLRKNTDTIGCDRPVFFIADEANMLLDDHLDEAYLSDCSNSNLGPSGSIGSAQDILEPLSKQTPCTDVKYSKISILSEEIIQPSTFNVILKKSKKYHQKENFIPVSINTVVSLNHKNSNDTKRGNDDVRVENKTDTIITSVERHFVDEKPILIEFIDEYEHSTIQNQLYSSADTVSEPNVISPFPKEEPTEEASTLAPQSSFDEIPDVTSPPSNDVASKQEDRDAKTKCDEKVKVQEAYSSLPSQSSFVEKPYVANSPYNFKSNKEYRYTETKSTKKVEAEEAPLSLLPHNSFDEISDVTNASSNDAKESYKQHGDQETLTNVTSNEKVEEIALYLAKYAHRKKNVINVNRKKMRNIKRSITKSRFGNKGVEKPGGADRIDGSQKKDECRAHGIWRTYRISQKMPHALNIEWNSHNAKTTTNDDKINAQNSTGIVDIKVDFDLSEDFGSICYYETAEDLYEHFTSDYAQISLEELIHETDNYIGTIYSHVACCNTAEKFVQFLDVTNELTKEDTSSHPVHEKLAHQNTETDSKEKEMIVNKFETHDAYEPHEVDGQLANDYSRIPSVHEYSGDKSQNTNSKQLGGNVISKKRKKLKKTGLTIFDAMEKDMNAILNNVKIEFLTKEELLSGDENNIDDVGSHFEFEVPLCDEESVEADGGQGRLNVDKPNESLEIISKGNKCEDGLGVARERSTTRKKRRQSAVANTTRQDRVEAAPSPKKTVKCGVCQKTLSDNEWNDHLSNEHCCIAWKVGETIDFKSNVLLSNLNSRLVKSPLKCTFCNAEYRACKKFLAHVRRCFETYETSGAADLDSCECGVCHDRVASDQWFEHISTRHHYIAWKAGETPIKLKKDVNRHLETVLMLHGCLRCSECGFGSESADSFSDHINTCGKNSSNNREDMMRRQSSDSESDMKRSDLKKCKKTSSQRSSTSSVNRSLRNTIASPESQKKILKRSNSRQTDDSPNRGSSDSQITRKHDISEETIATASQLTRNLAPTDTNSINKLKHSLVREENSEKRKSRKPAANETANRENRDKSVTVKVLDTEPKTPKLDNKSEDSEPTSSLLLPTQKIRKLNKLPDEINSAVISQEVLPDSHITENATTAGERPARNSRKSVSCRTPDISKGDQLVTAVSAHEQNAGEPGESKVTPRNKRKCTQDRSSPEGNGPEGFPTGRSKSKHDRKNVRPAQLPTVSDPEVSTRHSRKSTQGKRAVSRRNSLEDSSQVSQDVDLQIASDNSEDVLQVVAVTEIKSEPVVPEELVECGVCQEHVEANNWISHSHMNHQYLAWQTGEKALNLEDEYEVVEHLKSLVKSLGAIACAKCGLVRKQPRKFLSHIETCDVSGVEVPLLNHPVEQPVKSERYSDDIVSTNEIVTCAVCQRDVNSDIWEQHAFELHYNIAWPVGGVPIDLKSNWQIEKILKAYKATAKVMKCNVCGITRASGMGFYAHIIVCGKKDEEVEPYKDTCEVCKQKYLCVYRQPHYAFHAQQELAKRRKQETQELRESLAREKQRIKKENESGNTPNEKRKAAEKARQFVSDNYGDIKEHYKHQCPDCDYGTDSKIKWGEHICGRDSSDDGDSYTGGEEEEEEEEGGVIGDSYASDEDQPENSAKKKYKKKKKSADSSKPRLVDVPFKVSNIKTYLKKSDKDFCNFHFTSNRLFTDWLPTNYEMIPDDLAKPYWPPLKESCKVKSADDGWITFKTFEARFDQVPMFFVGTSPNCMSWAPPLYGDTKNAPATSFLAIAGHGPRAPRLNFDQTYRHRGLLQLWDFGLFDETLPSIALCIAHDYGTVWAMDWCPSGARDAWSEEAGSTGSTGPTGPTGPAGPTGPPGPARLGLLAAACSDGAAYIFSVPYPATLPDRSSVFHKTKPVAELRFDDRKQFQCTTIKWSSQKGHATVAAGYSDGTVAFFNLDGGSPLGQSEEADVWILYPYHDERIQSTCIAGLDLFASTEESADTGLACAASATGLSLWASRGATVAKTQVYAACAGAQFQPHWPSVLSTGEDQLAVTEVEWDGWRGRAGPRVVATSARSGLVAGYHPPVIRATLGHRLRQEMPRKKVAAIEMKPLSGKRKKERKNTEFEMKVEPLTYDKAIAAYGLQLTLLKNDRPAWPNIDESRPERYPLSEVTALAFCPHPRYPGRLAAASHAGLVFLLNVTTEQLFPEPRSRSSQKKRKARPKGKTSVFVEVSS